MFYICQQEAKAGEKNLSNFINSYLSKSLVELLDD